VTRGDVMGTGMADSARSAALGWHRAAGFTYLGVLLLVAMMGIALVVVSQVWVTMQKRDKEEELLFVGGQFRRALALYYANTPGGGERYPRSLDDLLKDPRYPGVRRYLRKIYHDPITGRAEWGLVKAGDLITGVHSLSDAEPLKKTEFRPADRNFEGRTKYSDWVFLPRSGRIPVAVPPGGPVTPLTAPPPRPGTAPSGAKK
jgi:type II secretory pathway pseudopilin PulG